MTGTERSGGIIKRLDQLNEFDRQPVSPDKLQSGMYFAGSLAGEHVAATEFVIGALFVAGGAGARDVILGLLLGNLLAVLSWALICTPIAFQTRLTLYWYLRKIAGPVVTIIYNVLNAVLYCVLAGCMITVAASAVRIPFGIEPQTGWLPTDPWFVVVTIGVGAAVVVLAILGFKRLAQFASVCSPWMFVMFIAGALVLFPKLTNFGGLGDFWRVARQRVWTGAPPYQSMEVVTEAGGTPYIELRMAEDQEMLVLPPEFPVIPAMSGEPERPTGPPEAAGDDQMGAEAEEEGDDGELEGVAFPPPEPAQEGDLLGGFAIAGGRQRQFVPATATVGPGNTIRVSHPSVPEPEVAGYRDFTVTEGVAGGGRLLVRPRGTAGEGTELPPFRTYVRDTAQRLSFWHIVAFAWICNLAMHLGLSDMALFRYARRPWYGVYSAFGMYLGHYVAWICAGIMGAAVASGVVLNTPLTLLDSGEVAFRALGFAGAVAVVIAGWTTSNPTLYRAGLALQVVTPGWPRWLVTLLAGAVTTAIACFPFVFRELLGFVALYGLLLMPVGAIVVVEHWVFPRIGYQQFWSSRRGQPIHWPALISWSIGLAAALACWFGQWLHPFFLALPVWLLTAVLYVVLSGLAGASRPTEGGGEEEPPAPAAPSAASAGQPSRHQHYFSGLAAACLLSILLFAYAVCMGYIDAEGTMFSVGGYELTFNGYLLVATGVYFVSGVIWMVLRERRRVAEAS